MGSETEKEYAAFEEKVKRTVYLDNLSPQVSEEVLRKAFKQFHGTLTNIHFIPSYTEPSYYSAKFALLEFENQDQAKEIIDLLSDFPFMILGMPRPVRAFPAEPQMFDDRPSKAGRRLELYWLDPKDSDFDVAQQLKNLAEKHVAQQSFLLKKQLEEEEKLSKQQAETLNTHYQKLEMINSALSSGSAKDLARLYGVNMTDVSGI
ncbi:paraspeckle component 1-like [Chenopodium quinoa]|uniref:paraspeckle component 1-like n=1 Tax=Chenopodium quinoa TaxID=63459 RepID=UPI000B79413F|nr:paraspeckle component 1-like [Chenopodium quinoa]